MRNRRYRHPDRPAARAPYETLTVGRLVASLLAIPLFVAVLAVPTLVVAATLGAASAMVFERVVGFFSPDDPAQETTESTGDTATGA